MTTQPPPGGHEPPAPEVYTADLDHPTVAALFDDIERHSELVDVRVKEGADRQASLQPVSLRGAEASLAAGEVRGVQVTYRLAGEVWRDTLLRLPVGHRLVRVRMSVVSKDT